MRLFPALSLLLLCMVAPAAAGAATVSVDGDTLRVTAGPGEYNVLTLAPAPPPAAPGVLAVSDSGYLALAAGAGCTADEPAIVSCAGAVRAELDLGDLDDTLTLSALLPARALGGLGSDTLTVAPTAAPLDPLAFPAVTLDGGDGHDTLTGAGGADVLDGGAGDDKLAGAQGADSLDADGGRDSADGGPGADAIVVRDRLSDLAYCGTGRDRVRAEVLDQLDFACERVDYGRPGKVGRLRPITGGGGFVVIPGMPWAKVDRRILPDVLHLVRRYHVIVGDGYAPTGHKLYGEHPLGLAVDLAPGPGGTWRDVDRLARWAEPSQNRPRPPFRWVGYTGDAGHGNPRTCKPARGCPPHLHLSWAHSPGRPRHPVRTVWVWDVRGGAAARPAPLAAPAELLELQGGAPDG